MARKILTKCDASAAFTITLASMADTVARQSDLIANTNDRPGALVYLGIKSGGTAPTLGAAYEVFLLRANKAVAPEFVSDGGGTADAAIVPLNSTFLGAIFLTASTDTVFWKSFDTSAHGPLGPMWGIAVRNSSGQALNAAGHIAEYVYYYPELQ